MNLPLNGRIAIVDDQLKHAEPLIKVLSKNEMPHTYFSGEVAYLPEEGKNCNDIRVLFLDINLIDDSEHENKVLKSRLLPVLDRIISKDNYPYVIIYWSRHERHKDLLENDIFSNELKLKRPIGFLSAAKSQFFNLDGQPTDDINEKIEELLAKVNSLIGSLPAYGYLVGWENQVHLSTDNTLQNVFCAYHSFESWSDNANYLINKFGKSYSGKFYDSQTPEDKLKSSFQAFNTVFMDSLEYSTSTSTIHNAVELEYDEKLVDKSSIFSINKNLLITDDRGPIDYPGAVTEDLNEKSDAIFNELLNNSIGSKSIDTEIRLDKANREKSTKEIGTLANKFRSGLRKSIRTNWKKIYVVVTPLCDYVQAKFANSRGVKGMLISSEYTKYIDDKSEAIFISPEFIIDESKWVIVLNFRYFFTAHGYDGVKGLNPLFRVRLQLLAEIQSKLARHISRQGILFLDE